MKMTEKQASSEIAQSRERFDEFVKKVAAQNPAGLSSIWVNAAWDGYRAAERDTRERCAQIAEQMPLNTGIYVAERIRGKE